MKAMKWVVLATALAVLPADWASAQQSQPPAYARIVREGYSLDKAEAEKIETALAGNPDDLAARTRLLGYYWRGARQETPEARIAARRRHILWLIKHHPASEAAGLRQLTIDSAGHAIADKDGYEQLAKLWMQQAQRHASDAAVLGNAGDFFLLPNRVQAEALYKLARQAAPQDPQWSSRLGYLYALAVLGLDMMNENGFPQSHNPAEANGDFAKRARAELEKSADAAMVLTAGSLMSTHGVMLEAMFRGPKLQFTVDYAPLTEALLLKAPELDPATGELSSRMLEQFRKSRRDLEQRK